MRGVKTCENTPSKMAVFRGFDLIHAYQKMAEICGCSHLFRENSALKALINPGAGENFSSPSPARIRLSRVGAR